VTDKISNTFCILPWIHLSTRPDGSMRVCCTANASSVGPTNNKEHGGQIGILKTDDGKPNNLNVSDFLTAWNSSYMRNIRKQMLNGEKPPSCLKCHKEESAGRKSKRMWETQYWSERVNVEELILNTSNDGEVPPNLAYIDLRFGTKCQLACVMCSPHDSSGWIKDYKAIFPAVKNETLKETMQWQDKGSINGSSYNWHKQNPIFWQQFYDQMSNMQQIYFAGGESLIIDEHYKILEHAIEQGYAKNLELRYNSNAVEWREDLFDLWKEFKVVRFHYSVDDIFERNEYIRYPSKWNRTEEVFRILDKETSANVEVTIACSVQALNIYYIPDFIKWKIKQKFEKINVWPMGAGMINYHLVYHPPQLNIKVLPKWFKKEVRRKYNEFYTWIEHNWEECIPYHLNDINFEKWRHSPYGLNRLDGILNFMDSEDWSQRLPELEEFLSVCDQQRRLDWKKVFFDLTDIFTKDDT
jgi:hypothetical protein